MTLAEENIRVGRRLIRHAEEELEEGEMLQASEKAWGAVVHHLKGIARQRGWSHGGHYDLSRIVDRLAEETGQSDMQTLFSVAESLHGNFYNNWKTEEMVRSNVEDSKRLLAMLGIVYDNGG